MYYVLLLLRMGLIPDSRFEYWEKPPVTMWHAVYSCYETTFNVERRFGSGAAVKASMVRLIAARRLVNKQQLKGRGTDNVERRTINGHPDGIVPLT